jgi:RNA recognition motif-containing protein
MSKRRLKPASDDNDEPPMSRLFVVCSKTNTEEDFQTSFGEFGEIEDIRILKERDGTSKGVAFVKFAKTSEAATACEAMNGKTIGNNTTRPIKVLIAAR